MTGPLRPSGPKPSTRIVISTLLALAIVALVLAANSAENTATATSGGPEMALNIEGGDCDDPVRPTTCHVARGGAFTLSVEVVTAPPQGYILMQSFVDYGLELLYTPSAAPADEFAWPDCNPDVSLRVEPPVDRVHHSCLTGLSVPPPTSNYVGGVVALSFNCSIFETSTDVKLRPYLDVVADTLGALFNDPSGVEIIPKVSDLTVTCSDAALPTATDTDTPPPTSTVAATLTPTPTTTIATETPTEPAVTTATATFTPSPTAAVQATVTATTEAQLQTSTATPTATSTATTNTTATATPTTLPPSTFTPTSCPAASIQVGGTCATVTPTNTPAPEALVGDTSCDGMVNPLDAALILQLAAGMIPALPCPGNGDVSGDGIADPFDAALILQFSAGLLEQLPP